MAKILLVEDNKIILNMYRVKLTRAGHTVNIAENGEEGLKLMRSFKPDVVLMDLMMPVMDGFTALTKAKEDADLKDIPIVVLSNLSQSEDAQETMNSGAADFIVKSSMTPSQVLEKIQKYLPHS